jgi:hypothetical protein
LVRARRIVGSLSYPLMRVIEAENDVLLIFEKGQRRGDRFTCTRQSMNNVATSASGEKGPHNARRPRALRRSRAEARWPSTSRSATAQDSGTRHRDPAQPHAHAAEHSGVDVTAPGRSSAAAGGSNAPRPWDNSSSGTNRLATRQSTRTACARATE